MQKINSTPHYRKISEEYRSKIMNGELPVGAAIPSQTELASIHDTSVVTIRRALAVLVEEGLIYRVRKKGTFVRSAERNTARLSTNSPIKKIYFVYYDVNAGILSQDIHRSMLEATYQTCKNFNIELAIVNLRNRTELPDDKNCGYILWGFWSYHRPELFRIVEKWNQEGRQMITLHHYFPLSNVPHVNCDNFNGGYLATQHLLSLGHERIGIIITGRSQVDINPEFSLRLQGYLAAHSNHGIAVDSDLVYIYDAEWEPEVSGYTGFQKLISLPHAPTAIFAASDFKAIGAMYAARDMGLRVPEDISIIGYDGYHVGQLTEPPLTTIDQNLGLLGKVAVERLLGNAINPSEFLVAPHLVLRNSTRKI